MKITQLTTTATTPMWAGSVGDRATLLSCGAKLDGTAFAAKTDGTPRARSGTLVSRDAAAGAAVFTTFNAAHAQYGFIWTDVTNQGAGNPDVEIMTSGEVRLDRLPTALTQVQRDAIKQQFVLTTGDN